MSLLIEENAVVLFQGDSITDAGRSREDHTALGAGYAAMAAAWFTALYPGRNVTFLNRGIGGHHVTDLQGRWKEDCLDLKPTWVSILIGINDCGHRYSTGVEVTTEAYEAGYRDLLTQVRDRLAARIVICEPFLLAHPERLNWREDLDPKIGAARALAREFADVFIPFDGLFAQACTAQEPAFWAPDGVHPTAPGHALMAQAWLRGVGAV